MAFLILSILWVMSEIALAYIARDRNTRSQDDKSSLRIIWITISLALATGIFLRKTDYPIHANAGSILYYSGMLCIVSGLVIR